MNGKNLNKWRVEFMVNFSKHYFVYAEDEQDAWEKADEVMAQDTTITPRFATEHIEHTDTTKVNPRYKVVAYVRAEPDEPDVFDSIEDAQAELEHLEAMNDGETTYEIEEVVDG